MVKKVTIKTYDERLFEFDINVPENYDNGIVITHSINLNHKHNKMNDIIEDRIKQLNLKENDILSISIKDEDDNE